MKVNTDAVLLGSWSQIKTAKHILDIGTGSGIIAIMLTQRSKARVDALDIHSASCKDAAKNIENCPWRDRLNIYNLSFSDFLSVYKKKYDLVVSNPPFHNNSLKSPSEKVNLAKHTTVFMLSELIIGVKKILNPSGRFCIILPYSEYQNFKQLAGKEGLFSLTECIVLPKSDKPANRVLIEFGLKPPVNIKWSEIIIRESSKVYHESYINLTKDFYLHF